MSEMSFETFRLRRTQLAQKIYEKLRDDLPNGCVGIDSPDSIGSVGFDYGEEGYILLQVEDGTLNDSV